jgi:hypothetical protein
MAYISIVAEAGQRRYLGKITDTEAMKWIENLYG